MIEPVKSATVYPIPAIPGVMYCRKETGGALGRRLITLLFAGWAPHDSVFVAEEPLSLMGHRPEPAQAFLEGFPDGGCALSLPANNGDLFSCLYAVSSLPRAQINPASSRAMLTTTLALGLPFWRSR